MRPRHVLAAMDETEVGRHAVRVGADLAARAEARLTVLRVLSRRDALAPAGVAAHTRQLTEAAPAAEACIAHGLPGIEIVRAAERLAVDLIVLGRRRRTKVERLLLGDTADSVARRSQVPCLFVPAGQAGIERVLVALDGTDRGLSVLVTAIDFAQAIGAHVRGVTVERRHPDEPEAAARLVPDGRTERLRLAMERLTLRSEEPPGELGEPVPLAVRCGPIVDEIQAEIARGEADVLAVGYHRGGPPGVIDAGSTARRLAHTVPCAVLTVPL